jgi:DNA gyrase/topoisomerase IV subunit B
MPPKQTDTTTSIVQTLVLYSLAEHQLGHAKTIHVAARGHSFSVEDDGRGHAVSRVIEGSSYLNFIYGHLDYPYQERKAKPVQLQGLGMSLLNRLCAELLVSIRKPEVTLQLQFQNGCLQSHEVTESKNRQTGNKVAGTVHQGVAPMPADDDALKKWLLCVLEASPSLHLHFNGEPLDVLASGALYLPPDRS